MMPDSYFILIANLVFSTTAEITYRDYKKGDKYYDTTLRRLCQRKAGIPCWVSVYSAKSEDTVVGFVSMDMPYKLTEGEEKAVRKKMRNPKKEGVFGLINYVDVDKNYQGGTVGDNLLGHSIQFIHAVLLEIQSRCTCDDRE
mmetsp:Transcript_8487/g.9349  ORF Transcript_8487/g.9349 Transcript_8487/m.9349 type:complete len:142 (-) Transcript_8487:11-436(-)